MKNSPFLSLGLPVFNGEKFLKSTLDSIINQSYKNFELIISDNCSTDSTEKICMDYVESDPRIKYSRNESNLGAAGNFNKVFRLSKGIYFKWATHDDVLLPSFLEKCVEVLEAKPKVSLCYSKRIIINEMGEEIDRVSDGLFLNQDLPHERYQHFLKRFRYTTMWAIPVLGLFRRKHLEQTRLLGSYPAADSMILCEVALRNQFYEIDEYLFMSRKHDQMSNKANPSASKLAVFYNPKNKGRIQFPRWKWFFENKRSIDLAPLSFNAKLRCYFNLSGWFFIRTKSLIADIVRAFHQYTSTRIGRANKSPKAQKI